MLLSGYERNYRPGPVIVLKLVAIEDCRKSIKAAPKNGVGRPSGLRIRKGGKRGMWSSLRARMVEIATDVRLLLASSRSKIARAR